MTNTKKQLNKKSLLLKKINTSRNRVHKKTNKFKTHKNIYYAQKGGSIETAKAYFIANYSKAIDAIRKSIYDDATLKQYITSNLQSIIDAKTQEIEALKEQHSTSMLSIDTQIKTLTSKNNSSKNNASKNNASKKQNIIKKKQIKKQDNTREFEKKQAAIQAIIDKLKSGNVDTIYDDPELLFEYMIAYLTSDDTNTKLIISDNIDLFVKFYLNGTMGNPNSITNFRILVNSVNDFELLKAHYKFDKNIGEFVGFSGDTSKYLNKYLEQEEYIQFLYIKKRTDAEANADGQKGAEILINIANDNGSIIVYWLKTADAAAYYGKDTNWCTKGQNWFKEYNKFGNLYMIEIKKGNAIQRYQLLENSNYFADEINPNADIQNFLENIDTIDTEKIINKWFYQTYHFYKLSDDKTNMTVKLNIIPELIFINIEDNILTNLQSLTFGSTFNKPLDDSLSKLTNLQSLTFGAMFNQPLGDSLSKLTNLQSLTFGAMFNQPLGDSLTGLTNLQSLTFGTRFNQQLDDLLSRLINLTNLTTLVISGKDLSSQLIH